ncbi:uncharacterized protein LOC135945358 [Cloeon dipterum]|uniref:uncharacterized protein LOC135945358 n=1 Tax=Cloeon dipterum TaxID=197152 RepID=UPI00322073D0
MAGERRKGSGGGDSRIFTVDMGAESMEARTPLAWQQRNLNYQQQQQRNQQHAYSSNTIGHVEKANKGVNSGVRRVVEEGAQTVGRGGRRSSSSTTATSSSSAATSKASRPPPPQPQPAAAVQHQQHGLGATWDGEPCPVHHPVMFLPPVATMASMQMPAATMNSMQMPVATMAPMHMPAATLPRRPPAYDNSVVMLMPPMLRPRPLVMPAASDAGPPEPLPMRDPKQTLPRKEGSAASEKPLSKSSDCRGHSVVLWFIISIITIGVLLGAVLRFVMG